MKTPPLLMLAALLFWGWQTELMMIGLLAGVALECSRVIQLRWDFAVKDLSRIWDLCFFLVLGTFVYVYFSEDVSNTIFAFFKWLPVLFLPMMLAQAFGHLDEMPMTIFSLVMRRNARGRPVVPGLNISFAYLGVCLLSASTSNQRSLWFFSGLCVLLTWTLWHCRAPRFRHATWLALLAMVIVLAFAGGEGLARLQLLVEGRLSEWIAEFIRRDQNPTESRTSLGQIGRLKLSGRVILRLESEGAPPALLQTCTYDNFLNGTWRTGQKDFFGMNPENEDGTWKLLPGKLPRQTATIASYLPKGHGLLALPHGTAQIDHLPASAIETNLYGAVQANEAPGLVRYTARFGPGASIDSGPTHRDRDITRSESNAVAQVAQQLGLVRPVPCEDCSGSGVDAARNGTPCSTCSGSGQVLKSTGKPAPVVAQELTAFFENQFKYTTYLTRQHRDPEGKLSALSHFLLRKREGHCEYFATATVLLMRQADIPARYATGYSVQESAGPKKFIVRERHAHAWVLYYDKLNHDDSNPNHDKEAGVWRELDTTPAGWAPIEEENAAFWEPFTDFFARLWYEFSVWRWLTDRATLQQYVIWLLLPLIAILTWRLVTAKRRARVAATQAGAGRVSWPGLDSEFYQIEKRLENLDLGRQRGETATDWIGRLKENPRCPVPVESLEAMLDLHYRYRFDPDGLAAEERARLQEEVRHWLARAPAKLPAR